MNQKTIMDYDTVSLDDEDNAVVIIDQTKLPGKTQLISLRTAKEIWDAIYLLKVRGAPAIGVAAAYGIYILAKGMPVASFEEFFSEFQKHKNYLNSSRPTAVNLSWALKRMEQVCLENSGRPVAEIKKLLKQEAVEIQEEDIRVCRAIGEYGLKLVKPGDGILTHCNAGKLAASRYGTATAPIYLGQERGYRFRVFADETRPLLQGARLTAYELMESGVDVTLICDNMSAMVMKKGWINAVFVGCDRVAANGDTANKIGTSVVAAVARQYGIPLYVCAPTATIDMDTPTGLGIEIEERKGQEVTEMWFQEPMAPKGIKVFNPAFDVTEHKLISGIITEFGIAREPYLDSFKEIFEKKKMAEDKDMYEMKQEYYTGIKKIDEEHERLFALAEKTYQLLKAEYYPDKYDNIKEVLLELEEYAATHFDHEETYMESINYKRLPTQRIQHRKFIRKLEELHIEELLEDEQEKTIEDILMFLTDWLVKHILENDKLIDKSY